MGAQGSKPIQSGIDEALAEIEKLRKEVEKALRALKRQAAPFSKGKPKQYRKRPGRKPGDNYGQRASRSVPSRVDETYAFPLPDACLHCGGPVTYQATKPQFQEGIVRKTSIRRFDIQIGCCGRCGQACPGSTSSPNLRKSESASHDVPI